MKTYLLISMLAALPLVAQENAADSSAAGVTAPQQQQGAQNDGQRHGRGHGRGQGERRVHREHLVQKFDANKDGKLDEQEKAEMEKFIEARRQQRGARGEKQGRRGHGARGEGHPGREEFMKKFDKNGDGQLDDEERAAMRKAIQEHRRARKDQATPKEGAADES